MNDINELPILNVNNEGKDLYTPAKKQITTSEEGNSCKNQYQEPEDGLYSCFVLGYN